MDSSFTLPDSVASAASHVRFHLGSASGNFGNGFAGPFRAVACNGSHTSAIPAMPVISRNLGRFICVKFFNEPRARIALSSLDTFLEAIQPNYGLQQVCGD